MRSTSILAFTLLLATLISARFVVAQPLPSGADSDDIFELLTPLAEGLDDAEIDALPTPALEPTPEPTPAVQPAAPIETDTARRVKREEGAAAIQEVDASPVPFVPTPNVNATPAPIPPRALSQQARLLLAAAPSASGNSDSPSREPLLVEKPGLLTRLSQEELRSLMVQAIKNCQDDFSDIQYGDRWLSFLNLDELQQHVTSSGDAASVEPTRKRFLAVTADEKYDVVTKRPSFEAVNLTLNEFAAPAGDRQRRREAFDSLQQLGAALRQAATGHQWVSFFKLAELERLLTLPGEHSAGDTAQLNLILTRFQQAVEQPQFNNVTSLPGFADTHRHLQQALVSLDQPGDEDPRAPLSGRPLPDGAGPLLRLVDAEGGCFHRSQADIEWAAVEQVQSISSGSSIRTADDATARLLIGEHMKLIIAPGATFSIRQYVDDSKRFVTAIDATAGKLSLLVDGESQSDQSTTASVGQRVVIGAHDYRVVADESRLALQFRVAADERRAFAAVYTGKAEVGNVKTGDRVLLRPGREAVLVPQGIALRAASEGPAASTASRPSSTLR